MKQANKQTLVDTRTRRPRARLSLKSFFPYFFFFVFVLLLVLNSSKTSGVRWRRPGGSDRVAAARGGGSGGSGGDPGPKTKTKIIKNNSRKNSCEESLQYTF